MNNPNNNPTDRTDAYDAQGSWGAFADYLAQEVTDFVRERDSWDQQERNPMNNPTDEQTNLASDAEFREFLIEALTSALVNVSSAESNLLRAERYRLRDPAEVDFLYRRDWRATSALAVKRARALLAEAQRHVAAIEYELAQL